MLRILLLPFLLLALSSSAQLNNVKTITLHYSNAMIINGVNEMTVRIVKSADEAIVWVTVKKGGIDNLAKRERLMWELLETTSSEDSVRLSRTLPELEEKYITKSTKSIPISTYNELLSVISLIDSEEILRGDSIQFHDGSTWTLTYAANESEITTRVKAPYSHSSKRGLGQFIQSIRLILKTAEIPRKRLGLR